MEVSEWLINNTPELKIEISPRDVPCAGGLQFGSRYVANPDTEQVFDYLPESMLRRVDNLDDFSRMLVFDKWAGNCDGRQAVFVKTVQGGTYRAVFIDQGYCFNAGEWGFPNSPLRGVYARNTVYELVTGWAFFEPALSRAEQFPLEEIDQIGQEIPQEWYAGDSEALNRLIETLYMRRSQIREFIVAFRNSSRKPFPQWK